MLMACEEAARRLGEERWCAAGSSHCLPGLLQIQFIAHFDDPMEAAKAYDVAVLEWRGNRAVTNFPADDYFEAGMRSMDAEELAESSSKLHAARAQPAEGAARPAQAEKPTAQPVQEQASTGAAASRAPGAAPAAADAAAQDYSDMAQTSSSGSPDAQADVSEAQPEAAKRAALLPSEVYPLTLLSRP